MFNIITYILVGVLLIGVFGILIFELVKKEARLIAVGEYDSKIQTALPKLKEKKSKKRRLIKYIIEIISLVIMIVLFVFAIVINVHGINKPVKNSTLKVVYSDSMSKKHPNNTYLDKNNLNNQFSKFDMVIIGKLPAESELKLYDVVVYQVNDSLIIHRIVNIQTREVDGKIETRYILKGDANKDSDTKSVTYDQMRGIYTGKKVPFIGIFIMFMQSPAGWICFGIITLYMFTDDYMQRKLLKASLTRYREVFGEIELKEKTAKKKQKFGKLEANNNPKEETPK